MMLSFTVFENRFDNKTHRIILLNNWQHLVDTLKRMSEVPLAGKLQAQLISPAVYEKDTTRSNKNVIRWAGWACVDVDDVEKPMDEIKEMLFDKFGKYNFVCYSTASCTQEKPKFRVVFELNEHIIRDDIKKFWYALNAEMGDMVDKQTKDLSRMFYIPGKYEGAYNFFFENKGDALPVRLFINKHPYKEKMGNNFLDKLPAELQDAVIEHRKNQMQNTEITWTGIGDCPFWPRRLAVEYRALTANWYHTMFRIMVSVACSAIKREYPITPQEIAKLVKEFDEATGNWYKDRPLELEATSAIRYAYANGKI